MLKKLPIRSWGVSAIAILAASPTVAFAQEESAAVEDDNVIVVTAQRRSENVQQVPISVTALSSEALVNANVWDVTGLTRVVPNLIINKSNQTSSVRLIVRGVGAPGNTMAESSVATFLDGVYIARPGAIVGNFLDMEAVEVLRGPQGTLFGRNASVGLINLRSADPASEFSGEVAAEYGTADRMWVRGHVNVPVNDDVAIRVAGLGQWFDGYWTNQLDGETYGGIDDAAGRVTLRADVTSNLRWTVKADYSRQRGDGQINLDFDPATVSPAQLAALRTRLGGQLPDTNLNDNIMNQFVTAGLSDRQWGLTSNLEWLAGDFTIKLIQSYRDWKNTQQDGDVFFTPVPLLSRTANYRSKSHSHELQLLSPDDLWDGKLNFVTGLYYFSEDFVLGEQLDLNSQFCNFLLPPGQRPSCNALLDAGAGFNATNQTVSQDMDSIAVFGQATFRPLEKLSLTLGGRWTQDSKTARYVQVLNNPFGAALRATEDTLLEFEDDQFTWRAAATYEPSDDVMLFATYSTGFKSGGFNSGPGSTALGQRRIFDSETVDNYELGARTSWLDRALTANITLFRMDIRGFQDRGFDGTSFIVRNAGNLRQQGMEAELSVRPSRNFNVRGGLAYLDSEFTSYQGASNLPGLPGTQDLTGGRNLYSPEFQGSVGFDWTGEFAGSGLGWSISPLVSFISDFNNGGVNDGNPQNVQDGYVTANLRVSLGDLSQGWEIYAFGDNLTDTRFCATRIYQTLGGALGLNNGVFPGSTAVRCNISPPRVYGIGGRVRF